MSRASHMLGSVFDSPLPAGVPDAHADLVPRRTHIGAGTARAAVRSHPSPKVRVRIWELHASLHCSIIGTCLTQGELRRLLRRLNVPDVETAGDHDLHTRGVLLAGQPKNGAKLLQKVLDRRHQAAIARFAKAKDADELAAMWDAALSGGDVPGAYWAVLTHPMTPDALGRRAFGDVHMLSHLMGATNRADLRRLCELEEQNAALVARLDHLQAKSRADVAAREETIGRLEAALARKLADEQQLTARANDADNFLQVIRELERRLDEEIARRHSIERSLTLVSAAHEQAVLAGRDAEVERNRLRQEIAAAEAQIGAVLHADDDSGTETLDLAGATVLYVGGRARQVPQLRALVERVDGRFLHHDGGIEHNAALLPGLVSRADLIVFPVDCVSHEAMTALKRACDQIGRPYMALRTSSLTCLLSALAAVPQPSRDHAQSLQ